MKTHNYWLKLFTVFIFTFLFSHLHAVQIDLNGTIIKTTGDGNLSTCHVGDEFILKNTTTYDGVPFDLKIKVTAEENEADVLTEGVAAGEVGFISRPCIGINDGMIEFILRDMPDENGVNDANDVASMDIEISTVRQDDQKPLAVNSLHFTALDLDKNTVSETDDIYLSSPSRAFKDANESNVTIYDNGNFGNGFDIRIMGSINKCEDNATNPLPECRVSGFIEINSLTDVLRIRIQNDNAFGDLKTTEDYYNAAYRLTQISFNNIDIVGLGIDHGDMPASYGDAYHDINISTILGQSLADREIFVPSDNADSDDADINASAYDDEGAVSIVGQDVNATFTVSQGRSYDFNVTTTGTGYLSAWIDYNSNGTFDAGEQVITDELIEDATLSTKYTYPTVTIPATAQSGKSYIRFRFSQNQGVLPTGNGGNGEVEDYVVDIVNIRALDDNAEGETGGSVVIDVLANDSGDTPLDKSSVKIMYNGTPVTELVVPGEGKWIVGIDGKITFVPENGYTGSPAAIKYTVEDTAGYLSNQATVTVTYPNSIPVTGDDSTTAEVGDEAVINLLNNDIDRENDLNASTVNLIPPSGIDGNDTDGDGDIDVIIVPNEGKWTVDDAGVVTFIPDNGFTADPTPIEYTVGDSLGNTSDVATIAVNALQQLHDDSEGVNAGDTVTIDILENDDTVVANTVNLIKPADSSVSASAQDTDGDGFTDEIVVDGEGTWTVDNNGTVTFVAEKGFTGNPTPITYTAQDNSGNTLKPATLTIVYSTHTENNNTVYVDRPYGVPYPVEVSGGTTPPVEADEPLVAGLGEVMAIDDNATFCEGTSLAFNAAANDVYADGTFNLINPETGAPMAEGERLTLEYGSVTMNKDGAFTYTPFPETLTIDAPMEEHFTYRLINVKGEYDTAKVNICIACCPESSDSVDALSSVGLAALLLMFGTLGLYFVRKEEEANI